MAGSWSLTTDSPVELPVRDGGAAAFVGRNDPARHVLRKINDVTFWRLSFTKSVAVPPLSYSNLRKTRVFANNASSFFQPSAKSQKRCVLPTPATG